MRLHGAATTRQHDALHLARRRRHAQRRLTRPAVLSLVAMLGARPPCWWPAACLVLALHSSLVEAYKYTHAPDGASTNNLHAHERRRAGGGPSCSAMACSRVFPWVDVGLLMPCHAMAALHWTAGRETCTRPPRLCLRVPGQVEALPTSANQPPTLLSTALGAPVQRCLARCIASGLPSAARQLASPSCHSNSTTRDKAP